MKLRQLVYLNEVVHQDCNISAAAKALYTSQPGISRQLQDLGAELGLEIFQRQGKRLIGLTQPGLEIAAVAAQVMANIKHIRKIAAAHGSGQSSRLVVVASRYAVATRVHDAVVRCRTELPGLHFQISEEEPGAATAMLRCGEADLGVFVESATRYPDLAYFPLEEWRLILVIPRDHPIGALPRVTLKALAGYPCCSYNRSARTRQVLDEAFASARLESPITVSLGSSAEILNYVATGIGIGLVGEAAFDPAHYPDLRPVDLGHLIRPLTTNLGLRHAALQSQAVRAFVQVIDPTLSLDRPEPAQGSAAPPVS
ncbi:LysR substrate-binding domain-containing protein [uncultured Thiodictyon sp.]|uniref:LysR substrate-binding domain-containing protein n=1 Tax=uncultured Thiodictyon sp. TaxID=1846217 RepID=UPI0025CCE3E5|nr:LysR substrate-binding domain-containing protein [uncultured Thiodictyon sp.]